VFFLYTFTGSMLTFAGVLYVAYVHAAASGGQWCFDIQTLIATGKEMTPTQQTWVLLALLAGFAVKVPLFPVHTWLPLAHTEAPTAGSVILAGVLLKLGTYGLIRLAIPMFPDAAGRCAPAIAVLAIIGILYTALICWVQKDLKKLIAYSSVSHLGFCVLGMFALDLIGGQGSVMYMLNHGLSTGALFLCVGMIYERFHTREMAQMSGLARIMPVWSFFLVFFALASVGLPGLNGFVGEFLCLLGAFDHRGGVLGPTYASIAAVGMIFAAIYILYMVGKVVFGPVKIPAGSVPLSGSAEKGTDPFSSAANHAPSGNGHQVRDLSGREIATLVPLALACLVLGLYPAPLLRSLEAPVTQIVEEASQREHEHRLMKTADAVSMPAAGRTALKGQAPLGLARSAPLEVAP
jgi:NADH-quinone oxidoreductase subunit M